eukprot:TRINITY_DN60973_c0_g1_i1.p1 TRINITY_DN60973_c0_g1~~TRINITY_DN60973_c0_g1_i1.p1  ORF type:complete len:523 (-),score=95.90 TRINITY_DN60973_c0_g1_i1:68-1597(-)
MSLAFAESRHDQRAIGNTIVNRPWVRPDGWEVRNAVLDTDFRDASGRGGYDTALVLLEPNGLDLKPTQCPLHTYLHMFKRTEELVDILKTETVDGIRGIMGLGEKMSKSHLERFKTFEKLPPKQACLALGGEALGAEDWKEDVRKYADKHLRLISGLYGICRPYDDVKPVRDIPMNARIKTKKGLYLTDFWGDSIHKQVLKDIKDISQGNKGGAILILKLCSSEYGQVIKDHDLPNGARVVEMELEGADKEITAKGRAAFARYCIERQVNSVEGLKDWRSQEWSLDEKRCHMGKVFYVWIGEEKKNKKKGKEKDKKRTKAASAGSDASGDDRRNTTKRKADREAADFSDLDSGEFDKSKARRSKRSKAPPPQDFSDVDSDEFAKKSRRKKASRPADFSDLDSGSGAPRRRGTKKPPVRAKAVTLDWLNDNVGVRCRMQMKLKSASKPSPAGTFGSFEYLRKYLTSEEKSTLAAAGGKAGSYGISYTAGRDRARNFVMAMPEEIEWLKEY